MIDENKIAGLKGLLGKYRGEDYSEVPEGDTTPDIQTSTLLQDLKNMENRQRVGRSEQGLWSQYELSPNKDKVIEKDIGYGHKLTPQELESGQVYGRDLSNIQDQDAEGILDQDKEIARAGLLRILNRKGIDPELMSVDQMDGLTNMAYQMGTKGLGKFEKMFEGFQEFDPEKVEKEAWNSKWAKAHPTRAREVIKKLMNE